MANFSGTITMDSLREAFDIMVEQSQRHWERRAEHLRQWHALDLDWAAMTDDEVQVLSICMNVELIVHPTMAKHIEALVDKYRRDQ